MKSKTLKKLNTTLPGWVQNLFGAYIRNKLFNNEIFLQQLEELYRMDKASGEEIKQKQFVKLKETLLHAYEHTKYYKKKFDECGFDAYSFTCVSELSKIPVLKRVDIIENFNALQTDDVTDYYISKSGGSSRAPISVLLDKDLIYRERAFIYHFWTKYGYDYKTSKIASFRGGIDYKGKIHKFNPLYLEIQLNPVLISSKTIEKYVSLINKFDPQFLHGLPSAVYSFCKCAGVQGIDLKNKYKAVLFTSENIYDHQKEFIEKSLGCKTYAYYGHTERSVFAGQTGPGYQFNAYYSYVEIDDKTNSIITTGFNNRKMPLIRYELDDSAKQIPGTGLYEITGHRDGFLYGKNNEIISAASLYIHDSTVDKVLNLQFIQKYIGSVKMLICPIKDLTESDRKSIEDYYQEKLGSALDIEVEITKDLVFTERGKMPLIVQKIKQL